MANSRFEYVKSFEQDDRILPGCWIVVRLDGKGFTKFSKQHGFQKPNDVQALHLMDASAREVLRTFEDIRIAFGHSDEFSFVLHEATTLYGRRASKLVSLIASTFSAAYVFHWRDYLKDRKLQSIPSFDGRAIAYPNASVLRDYLAWRQADAHINNQYNTCFWALVDSGAKPEEAQATLKGTFADFKNELLFTRFGINYNSLPPQVRKGSVIFWQKKKQVVKTLEDGTDVVRDRIAPVVVHEDIIKDVFWEAHPEILRLRS